MDHTHNIKIVRDSAVEKLRSSKRGNKLLSNVHNFDIFQNQAYADKFYFQWMERRTEHESSDMIAKLIYMSEEKLGIKS